jgi:hypothetical protein
MAVGDSKIGICNDVLVSMGIKPVINLTQSNKRSATINQIWDGARLEVLAGGAWGFAEKRVQLTQLLPAPTHEMITYWQLPLDYVRVNGAYHTPLYTNPYKWRVENSEDQAVLASNAPTGGPVYCRYTSNVDNPAIFSPDFVSVLKALLESRFAMPFRESKSLADSAYQKYDYKLEKAVGSDVFDGDPGGLMDNRRDEPWVDLLAVRYL